MNAYSKYCAICGRARPGSELSNSRTCNARKCEIAYEEHLSRGWACCACCGGLLTLARTASTWPVCNRSECQQQLACIRSPTASFCCVCGVYLVPHLAQPIAKLCGNIVCSRMHERKLADAHVRAKFLRREARRRKLNELTINQVSSIRPDLSATTLPSVVVLPYLAQSLSPLPLQRMHDFRATVLAMAQEACAIRKQSQDKCSDSAPALSDDRDEAGEAGEADAGNSHDTADVISDSAGRFDRLNGIACGTCGGKCCNLGRNHAFLNTSGLLSVLDKRPGISPEVLTEAYMQRIPAATYENSCVYHGIDGCGLPRDMRSVTCNAYLCSSLQLLRDAVENGESNFLLAATNLRGADDALPEVYRIRLVHDQETVVLKAARFDR